jgi:hypothetical protein
MEDTVSPEWGGSVVHLGCPHGVVHLGCPHVGPGWGGGGAVLQGGCHRSRTFTWPKIKILLPC